jgi:hypothetical protein
MISTLSENSKKAFPSALLYVHHLTLPTTPLQSATLQKPSLIPEISTSVLLSGLSTSYNKAHTMPPNFTQTPLPMPSTTYAANSDTTYQLHHIF